jgi:hypothetical protein
MLGTTGDALEIELRYKLVVKIDANLIKVGGF